MATKKFISWNVNGLRACMTKGFEEIFRSLDADIFCVQETKLQAGQIDFQPEGYEQYWNYAEKKGYSGTAVFTKEKPISVFYGLDIPKHDTEGRVITLEFEKFYFVCVYTPNSQDELKRLDYRMDWEDDFRAYLVSLSKNKGVVVTGDMNVAHEEIDLKNPKTNHRNPGFTDEERGKMSELLQAGFVDSFRCFYPDTADAYSWWSYRFHAREKNVGWRIDYFLVSESLKENLVGACIHPEIFGSDHCPVEVRLEL
ncbi:MAG TPA: exodeoxyribonuclease III [Ruminococcaceae bacterium]|nr:exodeoxyribonuclease III [Oscillospiraceae bacterium]